MLATSSTQKLNKSSLDCFYVERGGTMNFMSTVGGEDEMKVCLRDVIDCVCVWA